MMRYVLGWMMGALLACPVLAAPPANDLPIEIHSDTLDTVQSENKAVFIGNVIATQGQKKLRSSKMTVLYRGEGEKSQSPATADNADAAQAKAKSDSAAATTGDGIYRIEALGNVVFTTPTETAVGDKGIYDVDTDTIELFGDAVTLTQGKNVLKGTHVVHNMTTGRSVMTSGKAATGKPARVHGLFVPDKK